MADLRLVRGAFGKEATFGMLVRVSDETAFAVTLEPERDHNRPTAWKDGKVVRGGACIPGGTWEAPKRYKCVRHKSPKFGETFKFIDVPNRDDALWHGGNIDEETLGCVLVGHGFDRVEVKGHAAEDGIVQSSKEFKEFMALQAGVNEFWCEVIDAIPETA